MVRMTLVVFLMGLWAASPPGRALAAAPPPGDRLLAKLIAALADDDFAVREDAMARLRGHVACARLLRESARSPDAELRHRAGILLSLIDARLAPRQIARVVGLAVGGRADLLPDHQWRWGGADTMEVSLRGASMLAAELMVKANAHRTRYGRHMAWLNSGRLLIRAWPGGEAGGPCLSEYGRHRAEAVSLPGSPRAIVQAGSIRLDGGTGIFVSSGTLSADCLDSAIVIANGDVTITGPFCSSVVICDGRIRVKGCAACILIAREGVHVESGDQSSNVVVSGRQVEASPTFRMRNHVAEDVKRPLGIVRWFEPSDVGLALDGVSVKAVQAGCPLAEAGLRAGDTFISVDGGSVKNAEALRRALRKRLAVGGAGTFSVRRGKGTVTLKADLAG